MLLRVSTNGAPRVTLLALLKASRPSPEATPPVLVTTPIDGNWYVEVEDLAWVRTFRAALNQCSIQHDVVDALPDGKKFATAKPAPEPKPAPKRQAGVIITLGPDGGFSLRSI